MAQSKQGGSRSSAARLPRARQEGVVAMDVAGEMIAYDRKEHKGHCLNPTAAAVWRRLDGETTMGEMLERLEEEIEGPLDAGLVWLAIEELDAAQLLEEPVVRPRAISRREALARLSAAAGAATVLLPSVTSILAPPAHAQASVVTCSPPDTCQTFSCAGGCACVPTTEGANVCIVPTCVAPCTTTADCPPGTVCFTLGCCGPATYCVPIAPLGTNCLTAVTPGDRARGGESAAGPWGGRPAG